MNFNRALSFTFKDIDWFKKLIVGGFLNFIASFTGIFFFLGFFSYGYAIDVLRREMNKENENLPEWDDMGKKFVDGLLAILIYLGYLIIFGAIGAAWIVYVATDHTFRETTQVIFIVIGSLFIFFGSAYFALAGITLYALRGSFVEAFRFNQVIRFINNDFLTFSVIVLFTMILHFIMLIAGLVILSPFGAFWVYLVTAQLLSQYAEKYPQTGQETGKAAIA